MHTASEKMSIEKETVFSTGKAGTAKPSPLRTVGYDSYGRILMLMPPPVILIDPIRNWILAFGYSRGQFWKTGLGYLKAAKAESIRASAYGMLWTP